MFLCGVWRGSSAQLVGSSDSGTIFKHLPQPQHQPGRSVQLFIRVLSLLAIQQQLHGCSSSLGAMPDEVFDVPTLVTTVWIGVLGIYLVWLSQPKTSKIANDGPVFETVLDESQPEDSQSDGTSTSSDMDEYRASFHQKASSVGCLNAATEDSKRL